MTMLGERLSHRALAAIASARRATAVTRRASASLRVEARPLASLQAAIEPWNALAARALEPNVFHEPAFALAAAPVFGADVQVVLVWSDSSPRELLGLFPVRVQSRRYGLPLAILCGWTHPFAPYGTPLVHREAAEPIIAAWLDHLARDPGMPALMLLPYLHEDGPFATILDSVLARRGSAAASFDGHRRALLAPGGDRADYLRRTVAPKRRKELARQMRRLCEHGNVTIDRASGASVPGAFRDFLQIEARGWKGRAHTAAANDDDVLRFVTDAVGELADQGAVVIHRLRLDQKAIAAIVTLGSGAKAWCWKIAYDEDYARYSPGTQLLLKVTEDLLGDTSIQQTDSLATAGHPMIDHIWGERIGFADRLIALKPDARVPFAVACRLEAMRRLGISAGRAIRQHLRR